MCYNHGRIYQDLKFVDSGVDTEEIILHGIEFFLNIILVGLPEAFLSVFIGLIFLKRYDFLYRKNMRENIIFMALYIVVPYLVFANILFYFDLNIHLRVIMNGLFMGILIYLSLAYYKAPSIKKSMKALVEVCFCGLLSLFTLYILEVIVILILQYVFNFSMEQVAGGLFVNILFSLPSKILMFFIVYLNYIKQNTVDSIIMGMVWKNKYFFREIIYIQIIGNTILFVIIFNKFVVNNVISTLDVDKQFFIVFFVLILLIVEILFPWFIILTLKLKQGRELRRNLN